ncbi:ABC transporter [Actinophytocola xinjiangensis]|uniref:ABC transporter n=1 Tax=Actinophytocola xinjiangensis TaxID=485602 RepID=A0A7Z0WGL9_9PSEU|nr:ATP-binding cassette domain-containing protein [Actinophytocola xinjiangensis]OLF06117.1 ABC transporter [Actinophytocola xinjiangensis]
MGHVEVSHLTQTLPDGRPLLDDVSLRVGAGVVAGVVGPNGAGKTTLLRLIAGELTPTEGEISVSGGVGVLRQFVAGPSTTVGELLLSVAPARVRASTLALAKAERALSVNEHDERDQLAYATALAEHVDAGGYDIEVVWDTCTTLAMGLPYGEAAARTVSTLSGGEQKRLVLAALLRGPDEVLLLDEPDNYLDVPGKEWLEAALATCAKTVLLVSHDRALLANATTRVVSVEDRDVWVHGDGFATFAQARAERVARIDARRRQWTDDHRRLRALTDTLRRGAARNDSVASAYRAARTRLDRFERAGPPRRPPKPQRVRMRLSGGRTGKRALTCDGLSLTGLTGEFGLEVWFGERIAVLGANGTGKSRFLSLLAGEPVPHEGGVTTGARVRPGHFAQTHTRPDLHGTTAAELVRSLDEEDGMAALARYELAPAWNQPFETLSGGQQARLQILLLELTGATLLLLDEPTDNLDLASAEALQEGLREFTGTVLAITHDRWFAADFDRYLHFTRDGRVHETDGPVWY